MSNGSFGQRSSGPGVQGTVYGGPTVKTSEGTVYNGPVGGAPAGTTSRSVPQAAPAGPTTGASAAAHKAGGLFFVIAGLSVVNSVLALAKVPLAMALGLGITRIFDVLVRQGGAAGPAMIINLVVVGVFALIGFFARKGSSGAILIGIILYAADTAALFLLTPLMIVSLLVHGFFLFSLFGAYRAARS